MAYPQRRRDEQKRGGSKRLAGGALIFLLLAAVFLRAESRRHLCDGEQIPDAVKELVKSEFPSWRYQRLGDLSLEYQRVWVEKHPDSCPGSAAGHFQSPGRTSYAMLLVRSNSAQSGSKLVLVAQTGARWKAQVLKEERVSYFYEAVYTAGGGTLGAPRGLDALVLEAFDDKRTLFFWREGRMRSQPVTEPRLPQR